MTVLRAVHVFGDRSQRVNAKVETIEMVVVERMKQGIIFGILIMGSI